LPKTRENEDSEGESGEPDGNGIKGKGFVKIKTAEDNLPPDELTITG
jgi:hypothetical protein